ncbi:MAG: lipase family protein [Nitrosomonas sp.]|nr:MAG: lipase family protein [Nitrosomonas sp.]
MKIANWFPVRLFLLTVLAMSASMVRALPSECSVLTAPATYIESSGLVCLQKILVSDTSGEQIYKAALQWMGTENPNRFKLINADFDEASDPHSPTFSMTDGLLALPKIDIPRLFGTERYTVNLIRVVDSGDDTFVFELSSVVLYNNTDYVPNETWKPYGMLQSGERRAVDLLGRSIPYAKLADAVYDFDNTVVDNWQLIETIDRSSGMQAGVFQDRDTGNLVIAFRGTETCLFCVDFFLDKAADVALALGIVHDQFKHAYNFVQAMMTKYPGRKITVTGHSLGGGLAQAAGAALNLETFAFNPSPVPKDFFDDYPSALPPDQLSDLIFVIADVHDPVSNTDESGHFYLSASHVTPLIQFDFDLKEVMPDTVSDLEDLRFDRHSITRLANNAIALISIYQSGW